MADNGWEPVDQGGGWEPVTAPNTALDVTRSIGTGLRQGTEMGLGLPGDVGGGPSGGLVGRIVRGGLRYAGLNVPPEEQAAAAQSKVLGGADIAAPSTGAIQAGTEKVAGAPYQPQTPLGEGARYVSSYIPQSLMGPGGLVRNAAVGVASGAGGLAGREVGGPVGEAIGSLGAGTAAIRKLAPAAAQVGEQAIGKAAQTGFETAKDIALKAPIPETDMGIFKTQLLGYLDKQGVREGLNKDIYSAIKENLPAEGGGDVSHLLDLRKALRDLPGEQGAEAAKVVIPRVESAIKVYAPEALAQRQAAEQNYSSFATSQALNKRTGAAERGAARFVGGTTLGDKLRTQAEAAIKSPQFKFMTSEEQQALKEISGGTSIQNAARLVGTTLGGTHGLFGLGLGLAGAGAAAYTENPAYLIPAGLSLGAKSLYNRSVAKQAARLGEAARARSPLFQANPPPQSDLLGRQLLAPLYARPGLGGILGQ